MTTPVNGTQREWRNWSIQQAKQFLATPPHALDDDSLSPIAHGDLADAAEGFGAVCEMMAKWDGEKLCANARHVQSTLAHVALLLAALADDDHVGPPSE